VVGGLQKFENRLEQLISGVFARAFRSAVQPVEISAALQREVDNNAQILSRDRRLVPNSFHVELSEGDLERLSPYDSAMAEELTNALREHADQQSYVFPGPVTIAFEHAEDLTTGRFRVRSKAIAKVTHNATNTQVGRARALLVVNGVQHPLDPPGLVVGRGTEADLRINDPGVSRRHIEFQVSNITTGDSGNQVLLGVRDLGSTNGMLVDGTKVPEATLHDGSTVKIGNTTMTVSLVTEADGQGGRRADV
jgi:pSer/pThr/pTyr-binding forkhead associated (FHA) protein